MRNNLETLYDRLQATVWPGRIPAELGKLTNLDWLDLLGNQLTGEIPAELADSKTCGEPQRTDRLHTGVVFR